MKFALPFLFAILSFAKTEWKPLAESVSCKTQVRIEAKEGEKFVFAHYNGHKRRLLSKDGIVFQSMKPKSLVFVPDLKEKYQLGEATITLILPASMMSNSPSILVSLSGTQYSCNLRYIP